jgi:hypothetical protein
MKKILTFFVLLFTSMSCYAVCDLAPPTNNPAFCTRFKEIANCHCLIEVGTPCPNMTVLYKLILSKFKTIEAACLYAAQHGSEKRTSQEQCVKDWACYNSGLGDCYSKC